VNEMPGGTEQLRLQLVLGHEDLGMRATAIVE